MLDSPAVLSENSKQEPGPVRVGFVTQLMWDRYGSFWVDLVAGAGAAPEFADRERVLDAFARLEERDLPGTAFRLAAAQALALAHCDLVVLPRLNPESNSERGSSQDRWIADLPGALADAVPALGETQAVATYPDPKIESSAVVLLQRLIGDSPSVPRVWARHKRAAESQSRLYARGSQPRSIARPLSAGDATAVVAQPWLLTPELEERLSLEDPALVTQLALDPGRSREEGWRSDERLIATDAEVLGAARILSRRAGVARLKLLVDDPSGSGWLLRRLSQASHKPVEPWPLEVALGSEDLVASMLYLPVD